MDDVKIEYTREVKNIASVLPQLGGFLAIVLIIISPIATSVNKNLFIANLIS